MLHATPISTQVMLRDGKFAVSREGGRHDAAMRAIPAALLLTRSALLTSAPLTSAPLRQDRNRRQSGTKSEKKDRYRRRWADKPGTSQSEVGVSRALRGVAHRLRITTAVCVHSRIALGRARYSRQQWYHGETGVSRNRRKRNNEGGNIGWKGCYAYTATAVGGILTETMGKKKKKKGMSKILQENNTKEICPCAVISMGRISGTEKTCALEERVVRFQNPSDPPEHSVVMECRCKTCRRKPTGGWLARNQRISCGANDYRIHFSKLVSCHISLVYARTHH